MMAGQKVKDMKQYTVTAKFKNGNTQKVVVWADNEEGAIKSALKGWRCDPGMVVLTAKDNHYC